VKPSLPGLFPHFLFGHVPNGKQSSGQLLLAQGVEEVGLILVGIHSPEQGIPTVLPADLGVVPRGQVIRLQIQGLFQESLELDLLVAQNIGIGRAPPLVLLQEIDENPIPVLLFKIHCIIRNADLIADPPHIIIVFIRCAQAAFIPLIPVLHEDTYDFIACFFQHQCGDGGIHSPGHSHHYTRHFQHLP
jgi:hypothetical protein